MYHKNGSKTEGGGVCISLVGKSQKYFKIYKLKPKRETRVLGHHEGAIGHHSTIYDVEGFKWGPQLGSHSAEKCESLGQPV